jgi:protein disulfide-isomerase-like protein
VHDFYDKVVDRTGQKLKNGPWFIKFFAPWCGHCKAMNKTWDEFAEKMKGKVNVAKIDCDKPENKKLCGDF